MKSLLGLLIAVAVSGCATQSKMITPKFDHAGVIKQNIRQNFYDPDAIKDAYVSEMLSGDFSPTLGSSYPQVSCLRANGKNRLGGYTGVQTVAYYFRGQSVVEVIGPTRWPCNEMKQWKPLK